MERDNSFTCLVLLAGLIAAVFLFYKNNYMDATAESYAKVQTWVDEHPSAKPLLNELLSDGKLTPNEVADIRIFIKEEPKRLLISQATEAR
ncbi:hypothetical protein [Vibrio harveyi]|uniref:hypothetical protein n=1 Tax=Vibrio harveyi TaxID=669 RepID=UPI0009381F9D|nr:hypothetical protein [Vibrio harveyi]APP04550.1 hypothetical protein BG259_03830 [Vibrio harveyi]